ncbi:MAG: hypothetical protein OEV30_06480 [Ignavibacteria bacterium]|nr:hypothetical protein [Ignavibacteria bacterium]
MGGKAILLVTIGFGFILSYISYNISGMSTRAVSNMSHYASATESHNLALNGINVGLAKLYQDTSWTGTIRQEFTGRDHLIGAFSVTMADLGGDVARMRSISEYPVPGGDTFNDTIEVFFDTEKFNGFELLTFMTNQGGNENFWITGDTVWGESHSNGRFHVNGKPVFMDKVTLSKGFDPAPGKGQNKAVFKNGYETGVAEIPLPPNFQELIDATNPVLGGTGRMYVNPEIWVTLTPGTAAPNDGMVYVRLSSGGPIADSLQFGVDVFNGALVGLGDVHVQGTLDGEITIGSLSDIIIEDNTIYDNRDYPNSDDILGLVSENDVIIADNTPNQSNVLIDGSIFCRTGSLDVENYNSGPVRGKLEVHGSIVQEDRGRVGSYAGGSLQHGYYKRYHFDDRLASGSIRPPFYPGYWVTTYAITNWWENVRIPDYRY